MFLACETQRLTRVNGGIDAHQARDADALIIQDPTLLHQVDMHALFHHILVPCPFGWGAAAHDTPTRPVARNPVRLRSVNPFCTRSPDIDGNRQRSRSPRMKVGLFIPCYVDAFFPEVGIATLELLERFGCEVDYPLDQTCCGQPMANSGCEQDARATEALFVRNFARHDFIVTPSGSCAHHVRNHLTAVEQTHEVEQVRRHTWELVEFLYDVLKVREFPWAEFAHKVGLHVGCSTLRGLKEAKASEIAGPAWSKPRELLAAVRGIEFVQPRRPDECCGFGGTFSVFEEPVSARMGQDKVTDHRNAGAEYIVSPDMSCVMHQKGCAERLGSPLKFIHIAQVLNGARG